MSQENVEIVRRVIAAVNARDIDSYLALCTPDVEMVSPVAALEGADRGADAIRHYFAMLAEATSEFSLEVERIDGVGDDRVLALTRFSVMSVGGVPFVGQAAGVYDLAERKIRRIEIFTDRARALEALGLRE